MKKPGKAGAKQKPSQKNNHFTSPRTSCSSSPHLSAKSVSEVISLPSFVTTTVIFLIILVIGLAAYSNSFKVPFVFDDGNNIVLNKKIHIYELTFQELKKVFLRSYEVDRTVAMLSFAANYYFNRLEVFGYHLVNFLIHIAMGMSIYFFSIMTLTLPSTQKRYGKYARQIAVVSALLFVVHPVQTQAVTYIVQRMTSMAALFYMLSILAYINARKEDTARPMLFIALSVLCGLLSFGSKQNAVVLPATILLYEIYFFQNGSLEFIKRRAKIIGLLFTIPVITAMVYTRLNFIGYVLGEYAKRDFTLIQRVLTELRVLVYYIALMLFPHPSQLNLDYDFPLSNSFFSPPTTFLALVILFWIFYLAVRLYRRDPLISFGIFWFYGNLFLESSVLALDIINEHRLYLPSVTFFMIVAYSSIMALEKGCRSPGRRTIVKLVIFPMVIMILSSWTYQRNDVWKSVISILEDVTKKSPNKARQFINLGVAYSDAREFEKAIVAFQDSIKLDPKYPETHNNLGNVYNKMGRFDKAIAEYTKAITMRPNYNEAYNNMGSTYTKMKNFKKAIEFHKAALKINHRSEKTYNNLGVAYSGAEDYDNAIKSYQSAMDINPHFLGSYINMGMVYRNIWKFDLTIKILQKAIAIFPGDPGLYFNLGDTYSVMKLSEKAIANYKIALKLKPGYSEALNNLGLVFMNENRYDEAINYYLRGLAVQNRPEFHYNLALAYRQKGMMELSEKEFQIMITARPTFSEAYLNLGLLYEKWGKVDKAIRTYEGLIIQIPNHLPILNQLGAIYWNRKKDSHKSLEYYRKIIQIAPNHPDTESVKNIIARIERNNPTQ